MMFDWVLRIARGAQGDDLIIFFSLSIPALAYLAYTYMQVWREYQADKAFGILHSCQPMAVRFPTKWPLGLDVLKAQYRANVDQHLLAFQQPYIENLGLNFSIPLLGADTHTTLDLENLETILSSKFEDWGMGSRRYALYPFIGEGIFTQDGSSWKHSREMLRRPFLRIHYQDLKGFGEHVDSLITKLSASEGVVDLQPHFFRFTLATTTALIFGQPMESLENETQDSFASSFDHASWISSLRTRLQDLYWVYNPKRYRVSCRTVKAFAGGLVEQALRENAEKSEAGNSNGYAFIRDLYDELHDAVLVRDQLVNVLLAGRDTTACLLSWTFFLLVRNPQTLSRLSAEIQSVMGDAEDITRASVQKMTYLKCILNETLRLYPPVPINMRIATKTTYLPRGGLPDGNSPVLIRRGQGVGYVPYYVHRRRDLYGPDAMDFHPERWEDGKLDSIGWGYLPFHAGPRVCLGKDFALMEASCAIIRIIQAFPNIRLPPGHHVVPTGQEKQNLTIFLSSAEGSKALLK